MKRSKWIVAAVVLLVAVAVGSTLWRGTQRLPQLPAQPPPEGAEWLDLLSAERAAHWKEPEGRDIFSIADGVLHIPGGFPVPLRYAVYTGEMFSDFELHMDFMVTPGANSGLFLRSNPDDPVGRGMEVQVLDSYGEWPDKNGCGSLYHVITPMFNPSQPPGEWNSYRIRLQGDHLVVVFNGLKVIDADLSQLTMPIGKFDLPYADLAKEGYLMLQDHGGEVFFRNIRVRPL